MKIAGFLRGINVGGKHKVPMDKLKEILLKTGFQNVKTILNSGNYIAEINDQKLNLIEKELEAELINNFNFDVPVILIQHSIIIELINKNPFADITLHDKLRLYVSFSKELVSEKIKLPYKSADSSFQIINAFSNIIISYLDLSISSTPKGMDDLEKIFGKNITTRNWNTIIKLANN